MKDLASFQDQFQRAIVESDETVLADIAENAKEDRRVLLGVYQHAYVARLIEFLQNDYEKLHTLLGDDQFEEMARAYIDTHPSRHRNARWFGAKLPEFLATTEPYSGMPVLGDMARLELMLTDTFDATDDTVLTLEELQSVEPADWPGLVFRPNTAVTRFDISTNADELWSAFHDEETPPDVELLDESRALVAYRPKGMATYRVMQPDEAMMWDEAASGVAFSVLCEMMAMYAGEDEAPIRAAGYLQGWIQSEMLSGIENS